MRNRIHASLVAATLVLMGCGGGAPDAGGGPGVGNVPAYPIDSGLAVDAGGAPDAGLPPNAGARTDAGAPSDAGTAVRPGRPAAPTNLVAANTDDLVELSWRDNSDNESEFVVTVTTEYFSHTRTSQSEILPANTTNWSMMHEDDQVIGYSFSVAARNRAGTSAPTNQIELPVGPPVTSPPPAPTNVVAIAGNRQVSLRWDASPGADLYEVLRTSDLSVPAVKAATVSETAYTDVGLANGTTVHYLIVAKKTGRRMGSGSGWVSATPVDR